MSLPFKALAAEPPRISAFEVMTTTAGLLTGNGQVLALALLVSMTAAIASILFLPITMTLLHDHTDVPVPYWFDMPIAVAMAVAGIIVGWLALLPMMVLGRVTFERLLHGKIGSLAAFSEIVGRFFAVTAVVVLSNVVVSLGAALLLVPGLIMLALWLVSVPACLFEDLGPVESLARSQELTRGNRFRLFVAFAIPTFVLVGIYDVVTGWLTQHMGSTIGALFKMALGTAHYGYMTVFVTVAYVRLAAARIED